MRIEVTAIQRKNREPDKPCEDAYGFESSEGVFCLADGITRLRAHSGAYPDPSPAAAAAQLVVRETLPVLLRHHQMQNDQLEGLLLEALRAANRSIAEYGATLPSNDYLEHDFPGAVATLLIIHDGQACWGHLGDTLMLRLETGGKSTIMTRNQTQPWIDWFQQHGQTLQGQALWLVARRDKRNRIGEAGAYGALTGEDAALDFVETGSMTLEAGDQIVLLSDGFDNILEKTGSEPPERRIPDKVAELLRRGALVELVDLAEQADSARALRSDDKTAIIISVYE